MVFRNRDCAATFAFAGVFAGTTVVARFAATLPLTVVLALAPMFGRRRTTAVAFAGVFAGAAVVAGLATTLPLAVVHALAHMLLGAFGCLFLSNHIANLSADKDPGYSAEQQSIEISSFHTHRKMPHESVDRLDSPDSDAKAPSTSQIFCDR
jgi:hypothetical protein